MRRLRRVASCTSHVSFLSIVITLLMIIYKQTTYTEWEREPRWHEGFASRRNDRNDHHHQDTSVIEKVNREGQQTRNSMVDRSAAAITPMII
ncbi:hypothetical protein L208DRAFT_279921 [Tricholoma matsutake]|nr:hypothetical protein L208DRAFT_279921 [Tricholoma matsutake 945]